jgi:hypothetical protein
MGNAGPSGHPYTRPSSLGVRSSVLCLASMLLIAACSGPGVGVDASPASGQPPSAPPPAPRAVEPAPIPTTPPPPPEPVIERMVRTLPGVAWDPDEPIRNADFGRFDSLRHQEVGQTLEVTEAFALHRISVWFQGPTVGLPRFREVYYDGIDWSRVEPFVEVLDSVDDLDLALSIVLYRSPDPAAFPTVRRVTDGAGGGTVRRERDVIVIERMEIVSDQPLVGTIRAGRGASHLELTEPVVMQPGRWLVALRIDRDASGLDIIDLPIVGWESGRPPDVAISPKYPCEYTPADDPTPGFGFYWRDGDRREIFIPGFAKVQACLEMGNYFNPVGTGDIGLDLWGLPIG